MKLILSSLVLSFFVAWFLIPLIQRRLKVQFLTHLCAEYRTIVLTYDDGPSEEVTQAIAELLARRGVLASFFVIGKKAVFNPDLIARLMSEGHEVGNHTQWHLNAWKSGPLTAVRDIRAGRQTLTRLGVPRATFRPPYGKQTLATLLAATFDQEVVAFWTIDTRDSWETPRPVSEVLDMLDRAGGGVVLMHDFSAAPRGRVGYDHRAHVLELTEAIIDFAASRKLTFKRFCDLEQ